jgi:hypothetical protein
VQPRVRQSLSAAVGSGQYRQPSIFARFWVLFRQEQNAFAFGIDPTDISAKGLVSRGRQPQGNRRGVLQTKKKLPAFIDAKRGPIHPVSKRPRAGRRAGL